MRRRDFLALVGGLSGFLLFGLLIFVTVVQSNTRYGLRGNGAQLRELWDREKGYWLATAGAYVGMVAAAVIVGYARRGRTLSVYGVDPDGTLAVIDGEVAWVAGYGATRSRRRAFDYCQSADGNR